MIGDTLGDYRILSRLGRGGMGAVYLAEGADGGRVALKVLEGTLALEPTAVGRFEQELTVLGRLDHPRIVAASGSLRTDGQIWWYAMEYVEGRNLAQILSATGALEPAQALGVLADALEGLAAAHEQGIVHRDLKSANLLLDRKGRAKICDFGLARAVDLTRLTVSGQFLGSPAYVAPEQAEGIDGRPESDIYRLGVVLYEALTGTLPFRAAAPLAVLRMHVEAAPDAPGLRRSGLPAGLDPLVLRALAKRPEDRYPTADAFRTAVAEMRAGLAEAAPADGSAGGTGRIAALVQRLATSETVDLRRPVRPAGAAAPTAAVGALRNPTLPRRKPVPGRSRLRCGAGLRLPRGSGPRFVFLECPSAGRNAGAKPAAFGA